MKFFDLVGIFISLRQTHCKLLSLNLELASRNKSFYSFFSPAPSLFINWILFSHTKVYIFLLKCWFCYIGMNIAGYHSRLPSNYWLVYSTIFFFFFIKVLIFDLWDLKIASLLYNPFSIMHECFFFFFLQQYHKTRETYYLYLPVSSYSFFSSAVSVQWFSRCYRSFELLIILQIWCLIVGILVFRIIFRFFFYTYSFIFLFFYFFT